jgi:hypothetical protein
MLVALSFFNSGVPVNPMNTAFGMIAFITRSSFPLWVRWHSSTNTNTSPTLWLGWANAVTDTRPAVLQFDYADGDAVHIEHQIGPPLMVAPERHLLGNAEVVLLRLSPVDQVDGVSRLACLGLHCVADTTRSDLLRAQNFPLYCWPCLSTPSSIGRN